MANVYVGNATPHIAIFGDIMLDHNVEGLCTKIANEAPVPVIQFTSEIFRIGGCGNVLLNAYALGAKSVCLFSRIGNDENGKKLEKLLPESTQNALIIDDILPTITKHRVYCEHKLMCRYDIENVQPLTSEQENYIVNNFESMLKLQKFSSVIFSDYNKGFLTKTLCQRIIRICNQNSIPTIVDPKIDHTKYIGCTVIKPNKNETYNIFKIDLNVIPLQKAHQQLQSLLSCDTSVITLSGGGISAFKDNLHYHAKQETKDVIDVTGAGDVVCSVLGVYYPYIHNLELLIQIANFLASISVSHLGVYTIKNKDIIDSYKFINKTKILPLSTLPTLNSFNIVFTNGCFDILHSAHLELFKYCKQLGDIVIVGLNTDNSIKRLKGDSRPINSLEERCKILSAIQYIDFIIPFDDDSPIELLKQIRPTYLVKGGDYSVDTIIGKEYANTTLVFNYINGLSTTNTINKIQMMNKLC